MKTETPRELAQATQQFNSWPFLDAINGSAPASTQLTKTIDMDRTLQPNVRGFHNFLINQLNYLSPDMRRILTSRLDERGWPTHLQQIATANWQLILPTPWYPIDKEVLVILSIHGVRIRDMAEMFFEGRTTEECESMLESLRTGTPILHAEIGKSPLSRVGKVSSGSGENSPNKNEFVTLYNVGSPDTKPMTTMTSRHVPHAVSHPVETPRIQKSDNTDSLNRTEQSYGRSEIPYADSQKAWEQKDRDTVWKAMQHHMTARDIQRECLPFRSESAIQTRMFKERKIREGQATPTRWSPYDSNRPVHHGSEEHSVKYVSGKISNDRELHQLQTRYGTSQDQVEIEDEDMDTNVLMQDAETEFNQQEVQEYGDQDDDSDYVDEITVQKRPGIARKAPASFKDTPKKSPSSLSSLRNKLLNAIDAHYLPQYKKEALRKALRKSWPTHYASVEGHNAPLPAKGARWSEKDTRALKIIYETVPDLPNKYIKEFFPGRNEASISRQINSRLRSGEWGSAK